MVFAKTSKGSRKTKQSSKRKQFQKTYLTIVNGKNGPKTRYIRRLFIKKMKEIIKVKVVKRRNKK